MPGKVVKFVAAPSLALIVLVHAVAAQQRGRPPDASKDYPLPTTALPVEQQDEKPPVDRHGDPLPLHAVSRLGTLRFRGVNGVIQAVAVSGGKQLLGLGESPPAVILWDAVTGKEIRRFEGPARRPARKETGVKFHSVNFASFAVSPDGQTLAVATADDSGLDCPLLLFELATGRKLAEWPGHASHGRSGYPLLAFMTSTILVSAGHDGSVRVWDVTKQLELRRLAVPAGSHISVIVPSPDRKQIFVAGCAVNAELGFWTAWEAATGKLVHHEEGLPGAVVHLAVSPDGVSLALAMGRRRPRQELGYTEMRLYTGPGWKERRRWEAHEGDDAGRCSIVFSPDGKTIATGGADGKVRRWDAVTGKEIGSVIEPYQRHSQNVSYLNADTLFTFGFAQTVNFWDATTGKPKLVFIGSESPVTALAYSQDGRHVAIGGQRGEPIRVWEAASGKEAARLRDGLLDETFLLFFDVTFLQFSPDGTLLVSGDSSGVIRLWNWAKGGAPVRNFSDRTSVIRCFAFSHDGKSMATGNDTGIIRVWDVSSGKLIHTLMGQALDADAVRQVFALAFAPDGQGLFSSSFDSVRHWDLATGKEVRLISGESLGHTNVVGGLATSPGGRWVYSASYDGSLCVSEAGSGRLARTLKITEPGYNGPTNIALSHDGTRLAAAFANDWTNPSVHLWHLTTGQKFALPGHRAPVTQVAFSPDGRHLVSGSNDTTALVWNVSRLQTGGKLPDGMALAELWKDLGADDPKIAYAAVCLGAAAGDVAVARLKLDLKPAAVIDADKIATLVRQLNSEKFAERTKASEVLAALGPDAEPPLREILDKARSPEVMRRLERILSGQAAEHRRLGYAVEVLEMIGTKEARRLLAYLGTGASGCRLTREAVTALARLEKRP